MIDFKPLFQAVRQAAVLCQQVQDHYLISSDKGEHDPVTIADYGAQAILSRAISIHFPDDAILAEEQGGQFMELVAEQQRKEVIRLIGDILGITVTQVDVVKWLDYGQNREASRMWVIDPIDGTKGYISLRNYAIAVGLMVDRKPIGGIIGTPAYPGGAQLFHAQSGVAYMQPLNGGEVKRIHVSNRTEAATIRALESVEKSHANHDRMQIVREQAGLGSAELVHIDSMEKYARIAAGDAELYLRLPRLGSTRPFMIWDHCAGTAIVEAAGGKVTDVDGSPLDYSTGKTLANQGIIVSNGAIHDRVITAVQKVLANGN